MPTSTGETLTTVQAASPMLGVNLREDRVTIADTDLAKSINADLNISPGALVVRLGRSAINTSALADLVIRKQSLINGFRYQAAGRSLYRDFTKILTDGLSGNLSTAFQGYQPQNDTQVWAFIADGQLMQKDNGTNLVPWTIAAPTAALTLTNYTAGTLTGQWALKYTYIRKTSAGNLCAESNPSPLFQSSVLSNKVINFKFTASTDPTVTHVRIYRTLDISATGIPGSIYLFDQDILNSTGTGTSSQADSGLGSALLLTDNSPPNPCQSLAIWNETMWLTHDDANPTNLYFSVRFNPESFPPANFLSIGDASDPLQCCVPNAGVLGVFSRKTKYRILGNGTIGYVAQESFSRRGTVAYQAAIPSEYGVIFVARDGIWRTDFSSPDIEMSQAIFPLFVGDTVNSMAPINFNASNVMRAAMYKNRYYLSYASGQSVTPNSMLVYTFATQHWYFYDHPMSDLFYEEINNQLVGGGQDGFSYVLETGNSDGGKDIALECDTKDFTGPSKDVQKLFQWMRIDADLGAGDHMSVLFYVDDVLATTQTFTSTGRTEKLMALPQGLIGYRWRIKFTYIGKTRARIYPPAVVFIPLVSH